MKLALDKKPRKTIFMKDLFNTRRTDVFLQRFDILTNIL